MARPDGLIDEVRISTVSGPTPGAWKTVVEDSSTYEVAPVTAGGLGYRRVRALFGTEARPFVMDLPLLRDSDDLGRTRTGLYWPPAPLASRRPLLQPAQELEAASRSGRGVARESEKRGGWTEPTTFGVGVGSGRRRSSVKPVISRRRRAHHHRGPGRCLTLIPPN